MKNTLDRISPTELGSDELASLERVLSEGGAPCLLGREDFHLALPDPIRNLLVHVAQAMRRGETVVLLPENEEVTTKVAAERMGVSRPFVVNLIDSGQLPARMVGTHRRVNVKDLEAYMSKTATTRREALKSLFDRIADEGHYDKVIDE